MNSTATLNDLGPSAGVMLRHPKPLRMLWVTAAWGACFVAIQWGLRDAPVLWFAALRALVAGVALLAVAGVQHRPAPTGKRSWALISMLGLVNVTVGFAAMFGGVAGLSTGTAAVLANAQPLLILLPAWWLYGEAVSRRTAVALVVGFAGLMLVAVPGGGGTGAMLSLLAAVAITGGTLLSRRLGGLDVIAASGWHFVIGGAVLALVAAVVEGTPVIAWTPRFIAVLTFLSLVGSAATFVAWFTETQHSRLDVLSAWTFLTPVFGIALAATVVGERLSGWTAAGLAGVLVAMGVVLRPGPRQGAHTDGQPHRAARCLLRGHDVPVHRVQRDPIGEPVVGEQQSVGNKDRQHGALDERDQDRG